MCWGWLPPIFSSHWDWFSMTSWLWGAVGGWTSLRCWKSEWQPAKTRGSADETVNMFECSPQMLTGDVATSTVSAKILIDGDRQWQPFVPDRGVACFALDLWGFLHEFSEDRGWSSVLNREWRNGMIIHTYDYRYSMIFIDIIHRYGMIIDI